MKIDCGNKRSISRSSDLPDVSSGVQLLFQPLRISLVLKQNKGGYLKEFLNTFSTQGVIQTLSLAQLAMKPEGQRTWQWRKLHTLPEPKIKLDDIISINGTKYRVMSMEDNSQYGTVNYDLQEDYDAEQ